MKIRLKNVSQVILGGKRPTEEFSIDVDEEGVPLDFYWRRRFEEKIVEKGYVQIVTPAAAPTSSASPATPAKK